MSIGIYIIHVEDSYNLESVKDLNFRLGIYNFDPWSIINLIFFFISPGDTKKKRQSPAKIIRRATKDCEILISSTEKQSIFQHLLCF